MNSESSNDLTYESKKIPKLDLASLPKFAYIDLMVHHNTYITTFEGTPLTNKTTEELSLGYKQQRGYDGRNTPISQGMF